MVYLRATNLLERDKFRDLIDGWRPEGLELWAWLEWERGGYIGPYENVTHYPEGLGEGQSLADTLQGRLFWSGGELRWRYFADTKNLRLVFLGEDKDVVSGLTFEEDKDKQFEAEVEHTLFELQGGAIFSKQLDKRFGEGSLYSVKVRRYRLAEDQEFARWCELVDSSRQGG